MPLELPDALHTAPGKHTRIRHPFSATYNYAVVELLNQTCNIARQLPCEEYDLYEFGVLTGRSMKGYVTQLGKESVHFHRYWGFDSFVGLPQEDSSIRRTDISVQQWQPGSWSAAETLHATSYATLEQTILRFINDSRVSLVRGFYNESLTATLTAERGMRPALFVEIDCDLYLSAFAALDWMLANGLIVPGTLLVYNDWKAGGGGHGTGAAGQGEAKAHANIVAKYNLTISRIPSWIEAIWRIKSVPSKGP